MIANLLYTERRKKGLEIADVEHATGIRAVYLQALEQGKYDVLPGEVYIKGFIRNYGNYLGLDGAHLVKLYIDARIPAVDTPPSAPAAVPAAKISGSLLSRTIDKKKWSTLVVVGILILSAAGLYTWQKLQSPASRPATGNIAGTTAPSAAPAGSATSTVVPAKSAASRPVVLVARFSDRCWTSVIADNKTLYEGIPKNGETLTWEAERQIVLNLGNAAAVELTFNGQPVGKIGERGDVVVKTFTAAGIAPAPAIPATPAPVPTTPPAPAVPDDSAKPAPAPIPAPSPAPSSGSTPVPARPASPNPPRSKP